jgi:hypothetical protein
VLSYSSPLAKIAQNLTDLLNAAEAVQSGKRETCRKRHLKYAGTAAQPYHKQHPHHR